MIRFSGSHRYFHIAGFALLMIELASYVSGLPPFQGGIWVQTEPAMTLLYAAGALSALWLAIGLAQRWLLIGKFRPLGIALTLWLIWQCVATLLATSPWRSWFGPPETGEGTAWYLCLLLQVAVALPFWQWEKYRRLLVGAMLLNLLLQYGLHWLNPDDPNGLYNPDSWAPAQWSAYLAFMAGYLWIASIAGKYARNAGWYCLLIVLVYAVLFLSHNKAAMVLLALAMTASTLITGIEGGKRWRRFWHPGHNWRALCVLICILPMVGLLAAHASLSGVRMHRGDPIIKQVFVSRDESMGSRFGLNEVALSAMANEPFRWLRGDGWGRFTDDLEKYALIDGVSVFRDGQRHPNWFLLDGTAFHSHNQPLEALLSLGVPGLLLWFAIPITAIYGLPRRYFWRAAPMVVALTLLGYFWFQLPQCMPFEALALAALLNAGGGPHHQSVRSKRRAAFLFLAAAAALSWTAVQQAAAMRYGDEFRIASRTEAVDSYGAPFLESDIRRGSDRLRISAVNFLPYIAEKSGQHETGEDDANWYKDIMEANKAAAKLPDTGARNSYTELWLYYMALMTLGDDRNFDAVRHEATENLENAVLRICKKAPLRDDLPTPFLINIEGFTKGDARREEEILRRMLAVAPHQRGALWVLGHLLLKDPAKAEEGRVMITEAVDNGVERVYPVTYQELHPARE